MSVSLVSALSDLTHFTTLYSFHDFSVEYFIVFYMNCKFYCIYLNIIHAFKISEDEVGMTCAMNGRRDEDVQDFGCQLEAKDCMKTLL